MSRCSYQPSLYMPTPSAAVCLTWQKKLLVSVTYATRLYHAKQRDSTAQRSVADNPEIRAQCNGQWEQRNSKTPA